MSDLTTYKPNMTFTAKHKKAIAPFTDDKGKVTSADVHAATVLIPHAEAAEIIKELNAALAPCDNKTAIVLANQLIGCYRVKDVVSPEIYSGTIAEMFAQFPPDIGERIRKEIVGSVKWVPTPAEVNETGDRMVRERNMALYAAKKHVEEHYRREAIKQKAANRGAERDEYAVGLKDRYEKAGLKWPGDKTATIIDVIRAEIADEEDGSMEETK